MVSGILHFAALVQNDKGFYRRLSLGGNCRFSGTAWADENVGPGFRLLLASGAVAGRAGGEGRVAASWMETSSTNRLLLYTWSVSARICKVMTCPAYPDKSTVWGTQPPVFLALHKS